MGRPPVRGLQLKLVHEAVNSAPGIAPIPTASVPAACRDSVEQAWPVALLGIPFDPVTLPEAVDRIDAMIAADSPHYVVTANVDFLVQAQRDTELRRILVDADLVLCDGTPLVWASRWLGNSLPGRAAGSDLVPLLLQRAAVRGWKIFILGGATGVADKAAAHIAGAYPTLPPIARYSPPFRPLELMDHADIAARIAAAKPDLLLVSFGCPKQEKWISRNYRTLGVPVAVGVGATVDFLAGQVRRAPRWMQRTGLEWLFRLGQEPKRLFRRYADDFRHFFPALLAQRKKLPPSPEAASAEYAPLSEPTVYGLRVRACEQLDRAALQQESAFWRQALEQQGHCLVDLGEVRTIDSTGLAFLAYWQKRLAKRCRNLILFRPSAEVRSAIEGAGLTQQFIVTDGHSPVRRPRAVPHRSTAS